MKKLLVLLFLLPIVAHAQQIAPNTYWLKLAPKDTTKYSLDKPEVFLTQRAIERRQRYNIPINWTDIPINEKHIEALKDLGLEIHNTQRWFNTVVVKTENQELIKNITNYDFVEAVLTDFRTDKQRLSVKEEPIEKFDNQIDTVFKFDYGSGKNQIAMLNGHTLHNAGFRGEGMVVGILDAGFYKVNELQAFDSLWANNQILGYYDFVENDTLVFDAGTHGMEVLSTIGANIPEQFIGTAPKAEFYLFRTEDGATEYRIEELNWVSAAERADSLGVDVINSSLGYTEFDDKQLNYTYNDLDGNTAVITVGADMAASKGILVVTSAGNEGNDPWHYIGTPGDADSVLTVGAVSSRGQYVYFSSTGPTKDRRVKPDVAAKGYLATVQDPNNTLGFANGTSFSSPIMCGMVACLWQANRNKNNMQIIEALRRAGNNANQPDSLYGYGVPDFRRADLILKEKNKTNETIDGQGSIFEIFPNPNTDQLEIKPSDKYLWQNDWFIIDLFDIGGNIVFSKQVSLELAHKYAFQLQGLQDGVYFVRVGNSQISETKRFLKL